MARSGTTGALFALLIGAAFAAQAELPANYEITLQTDSFPPFNMGPTARPSPAVTTSKASAPIRCATSSAAPASPTT